MVFLPTQTKCFVKSLREWYGTIETVQNKKITPSKPTPASKFSATSMTCYEDNVHSILAEFHASATYGNKRKIKPC